MANGLSILSAAECEVSKVPCRKSVGNNRDFSHHRDFSVGSPTGTLIEKFRTGSIETLTKSGPRSMHMLITTHHARSTGEQSPIYSARPPMQYYSRRFVDE